MIRWTWLKVLFKEDKGMGKKSKCGGGHSKTIITNLNLLENILNSILQSSGIDRRN